MVVATDEAIRQQIKTAIGAHGMWKQRLSMAVDKGRSDIDATTAERDDACDFGKWLRGVLPALPAAQAQHGQAVRDLHARFHAQAATVVKLATSGQGPAARTSLQGPYADTSAALTKAMMDWQASLPGA